MNKWLRKFDTTQASTFGYHPSDYVHTSYEFNTLNSGSRSKSDHPIGNTGGQGHPQAGRPIDRTSSWEPDKLAQQSEYAYTIEPRNRNGAGDGISNTSVEDDHDGRNNSDEMIIRKHMAYEISYKAKT